VPRKPVAAPTPAGSGAAADPRGRATDRESTGGVPAEGGSGPAPLEARRRASRSLWLACETLLSAATDPGALGRALETLRRAFDCDGVALHALGPGGAIEPWCARGRWEAVPGDLRDCISVPLLHGHERLGTIDLRARPGRRWEPAQLGLVRTASGALGAALGTRFELERLRRQPGRDPATGLPDPRAFQARLLEELARARRHGLPLALCLVELDHFGALEARYGRAIADGALTEAALVIRLALRDSDVLARFDLVPPARPTAERRAAPARFAVLLPETGDTAALRCADRLRRTLEAHRFGRVGRVSARAAVASCPRDGLEAVELLEAVQRALAVAHKGERRRVSTPAPLHLQ